MALVIWTAEAESDFANLADEEGRRLRRAIVNTFNEGLPLGATEVVGQPPWLKFEIRPYAVIFVQTDREGLQRQSYSAPSGYYVGRVVPWEWVDSQFRLDAEQAEEEHYEVGVGEEEAGDDELDYFVPLVVQESGEEEAGESGG